MYTFSIEDDSWSTENLGVQLSNARAFHIAEAVPEENVPAC